MNELITSGDLLYLLPLLVAAILYWLQRDHWPLWVNGLLALISIIATAAILIWLEPGFTGNLKTSLMLVVAYVAWLMRGPATPLIEWLKQANNTPTDPPDGQ